jgi:hypothetical protein
VGFVRDEASLDEQMLAVADRLLTEYAEIPIVTIIKVLHEARHTAMDWLQCVNPNTVYKLAVWQLDELTLLARAT